METEQRETRIGEEDPSASIVRGWCEWLSWIFVDSLSFISAITYARRINWWRQTMPLRFKRPPKGRIGRGYAIFIFSFSRFSLSFFSIARDDGQWRIPFPRIVELPNVTRRIEGEKRNKERSRYPVYSTLHKFQIISHSRTYSLFAVPMKTLTRFVFVPFWFYVRRDLFADRRGRGGGERDQ